MPLEMIPRVAIIDLMGGATLYDTAVCLAELLSATIKSGAPVKFVRPARRQTHEAAEALRKAMHNAGIPLALWQPAFVETVREAVRRVDANPNIPENGGFPLTFDGKQAWCIGAVA